MRHLETEVIPFLRDELPAAERTRIAAHVQACGDCRRAVEDTRAVLAGLAASLPEPPALDWGRYQAEVRARVEGRSVAGRARRWWARPLPLAASLAVAVALLLVSVQGPDWRAIVWPDTPTVEETALGARLGLIENYPVVERLDLLEDLDVIDHLDRLPTREG
jgi:anti-sigma factor RsiW